MPSSSRLHLQYPHVAALLEHFSRDRQSALAEAAAVLACEMAGVSPPARQASVLETLVQTMDETAWDLQDTDSSDYPTAFASARAINAWLYLAEDCPPDPAEAIYEAIAAIGSETPVVALLKA